MYKEGNIGYIYKVGTGMEDQHILWSMFYPVTSFLFWQLRSLFLFCMFVETIGATEILCRWILQLNSNRGATNNTITVETGTL